MIALGFGFCAQAPAQADMATGTVYQAGVPGLASSPGVLMMSVRARVGEHCGFAAGRTPTGTITIGGLDRGFDQSVSFALDCNVPARVAVSSAHGALLLSDGAAIVPEGFTRTADYDVQLSLVDDDGGITSAVCAAADLIGAANQCSPKFLTGGDSISFGGPAGPYTGLRLGGRASGTAPSTLRLYTRRAERAPPLIAGIYQDTLTVTISASN